MCRWKPQEEEHNELSLPVVHLGSHVKWDSTTLTEMLCLEMSAFSCLVGHCNTGISLAEAQEGEPKEILSQALRSFLSSAIREESNFPDGRSLKMNDKNLYWTSW